MATKSPVFCPLCKETVTPDETLEGHLLADHDHRELAKQLVCEWEADELGEAV